MPWTIDYEPQQQLVHVESAGLLAGPMINTLAAESVAVGRAHNCWHFLIDHSRAEVRVSVLEIYNRPAELARLDMPPDSCIAIVHAPKDAQLFTFFQNVTQNRGIRTGTFTSIDEARQWLAGCSA